ncbi:MAG: DUF1624 domain-containing protein [Candidatus Eisenbacteria bacterium]|uniref:DUF1624 domain-containing protein n=1 Tax=Eiseniibacteriota bacterium TaxID=2212470 RepID=A0A849SRG8_UNCEI|nr:DUF1624 domain-containing protein [Candidatus Eisenbacteria bacterium]
MGESQPATRRPEAEPREGALAGQRRLIALDAIRGIAIVLMTVDHAAALARFNVLAERYSGRFEPMAPFPWWVLGLVTNFAAPLFWFASGVSLGLFERGMRGRADAGLSLTKIILVRAGLLLLLDAFVISPLWAPLLRLKVFYTFDMLSSLGLSLALLAGLRFLPRRALGVLGLVLIVGFEALRAALPAGLREAGGFWLAVWLDHVGGSHPVVSFPVLGWLGLLLLGYAFAVAALRPTWRSPGRWVWIGGLLLTSWAVLRWSRGYGNLDVPIPETGFVEFLTMTKGPPSLTFLLFNLGLAALAYAGVLLWETRGGGRIWSALGDLGRAALFVYLVHLVLYKVIAWGTHRAIHDYEVIRFVITWTIGITVLVPLARWYRKLKMSYRKSVLKYL